MSTPFRTARAGRSTAAVAAATLAAALAVAPAASADAASHATLRVSDLGARESNDASFTPTVSSDGRYVAFVSDASNLVPHDTNHKSDVFLRDTVTKKITRVSVSSTGMQSNENSYNPSMSDDGRYIAFDSFASNLVPGDLNRKGDVFLYDRETKKTVRVSNGIGGKLSDGHSGFASVSGDGRFVGFESLSTNLVPNQQDYNSDVFLWNRETGQTEWINRPMIGQVSANGSSGDAAVSRDGRFVAFASSAGNLVPGDTNKRDDVYVRDRLYGTLTRVSLSNINQEANEGSDSPSISDDGRYIAFESKSSNLLSMDLLQLDHAKLIPSGETNPQSAGDTNFVQDVFVHDMQTGVTELVSIADDGSQGNEASYGASISGDGMRIAYTSSASNLVPGDTHKKREVFLRDRAAHTTERVCVASAGQEGNNLSSSPALTGDGRYVAFVSDASNLIPRDQNHEGDIFLRR
jgi:Tol biopolymer transport system component